MQLYLNIDGVRSVNLGSTARYTGSSSNAASGTQALLLNPVRCSSSRLRMMRAPASADACAGAVSGSAAASGLLVSCRRASSRCRPASIRSTRNDVPRDSRSRSATASEHASSNCRFASAATGIDFHTAGGITSTGARMRDRSGDASGGSTRMTPSARGTRYDQNLRIRDGHAWADAEHDLEMGRLVHLDIWAATAGGPCLSGSGAYGHTIAVAPERDGSSWLVADPWCSPPKWKWWSESKLRAGAEEWGRRCGRSTAGLGYGRQLRDVPASVLDAVVKLLMTLWTPDHPAPVELEPDPGDTGGSAAILYTTTRARRSDVTINATGHVSTGYVLEVPDDTGWYLDADLGERAGTLSARSVPYVGIPVGSNARAVILTTSKPYDDGEDRPSIVYVHKDAGDPEPGPDAGDQDTAELVAALEDIESTAEAALGTESIARELLAGVALGGSLVILAGATDSLAAGVGLLVLSAALAGVRPFATLRLTVARHLRRRPPAE